MRKAFPALAAAAFLVAAASPSPTEILATAPADAWRSVLPENLLLLDLPGGKQVAIELAPDFAPQHVANIRLLAKAGWFAQHASIVRVQENYVVQWGDATGKAALPKATVMQPQGSYERPGLPAGFRALPYRDAYAAQAGHSNGWPVASDGTSHWLVHCPGMVGAGRDMPPDTGTGAELYAVIGHGPRHLDRNIAVVGRVLSGMEYLSSLPRGTGEIGFYESESERVKLGSVQLAEDVAGAPRFEVMRSDSAAFGQWVNARANRAEGFFVRPAGAADICNLMPPVRPIRR